MPEQNKTLVILTPGFPESEADTTCLPMLQNLVLYLQNNYEQLNIIILSFQYPYHSNTYQWLGTTVYCFNGKNKGGIKRLIVRNKIKKILQQVHKQNHIAALLSCWYGECALVGNRFAKEKDLKHYCWILGQDAKKENGFPKRVGANANSLIALSDFLQDEFEKNHCVRPAHVITPAVQNLQVSAGDIKKDIDILGAGSLIPLKCFQVFIEMIAEIKKVFPAIKTVLAGIGPEKEKLQELIVTYGLQNNCILTGELKHPDLLQLMNRSKILLHPSSYEGFSGVCQEALYHGAHVISFCRAMNKEIEQWHIVENKLQMKEKLIALLQDPQLTYRSIDPFPIKETSGKLLRLLFS